MAGVGGKAGQSGRRAPCTSSLALPYVLGHPVIFHPSPPRPAFGRGLRAGGIRTELRGRARPVGRRGRGSSINHPHPERPSVSSGFINYSPIARFIEGHNSIGEPSRSAAMQQAGPLGPATRAPASAPAAEFAEINTELGRNSSPRFRRAFRWRDTSRCVSLHLASRGPAGLARAGAAVPPQCHAAVTLAGGHWRPREAHAQQQADRLID